MTQTQAVSPAAGSPVAPSPGAVPSDEGVEAVVARDARTTERLREAPERGVLFAATATAGPAWEILRDLAGLVRRAGAIPWLLLCPAPGSPEALRLGRAVEPPAPFDLLAWLRPAREPMGDAADWDQPGPDPALEAALARLLAELGRPVRLVAETPRLLSRLGAPPGLPRAVVLARAVANAPRRVFPGPPRHRLLARMRAVLDDAVAVLPDEAARLALRQLCPGAATVVAGPGAPAGCVATALGLSPALRPEAGSLDHALFRCLLTARLADGRPTGLLLDGLEGTAPAIAFAGLCGPGRMFRLGEGLGRPAALGIGRLLVGGAGEEARALAVAVEGWGLEALPLLPSASAEDARRLAALRGAWAGRAAVLRAEGLFLAGDAQPRAVVLATPYDPRRGEAATLFDAADPRFWTRPAAPALGFDAGVLPLLSPGPPRPAAAALLALALHAGCAALSLPGGAPPGCAALLGRLAGAGMAIG
ncbi:hypothetical protein LPC08_06675 [Roseomonas sp. OT10]|uniref:hypothetical protein n=1 Tax=Roseomonas cutis TaxID=2897332 RepID=UPI001E3E19A4|nr:hypothetical protein [Roseomonas sp. OT10]UFN50304.1 hypothetical protein LPC08_06675 [Roseomonas sp. OT10]